MSKGGLKLPKIEKIAKNGRFWPKLGTFEGRFHLVGGLSPKFFLQFLVVLSKGNPKKKSKIQKFWGKRVWGA